MISIAPAGGPLPELVHAPPYRFRRSRLYSSVLFAADQSPTPATHRPSRLVRRTLCPANLRTRAPLAARGLVADHLGVPSGTAARVSSACSRGPSPLLLRDHRGLTYVARSHDQLNNASFPHGVAGVTVGSRNSIASQSSIPGGSAAHRRCRVASRLDQAGADTSCQNPVSTQPQRAGGSAGGPIASSHCASRGGFRGSSFGIAGIDIRRLRLDRVAPLVRSSPR